MHPTPSFQCKNWLVENSDGFTASPEPAGAAGRQEFEGGVVFVVPDCIGLVSHNRIMSCGFLSRIGCGADSGLGELRVMMSAPSSPLFNHALRASVPWPARVFFHGAINGQSLSSDGA